MPVIRQGDYNLVGPSNFGRQLPNVSRYLSEFCRQRIYTLEQIAQAKGAAQQKKRKRDTDTDHRIGLWFHGYLPA